MYVWPRLNAQTFSSQNGGKKKLNAAREKLAKLTVEEREKAYKTHADAHHSQKLDCPPLIPCHEYLWDPMHAVHCELNVIIDEVRGCSRGLQSGAVREDVAAGARILHGMHTCANVFTPRLPRRFTGTS